MHPVKTKGCSLVSLVEGRPTDTLRAGAVPAVIAGLRGWRRAVFSFGLGAISVLGFAPFHIWPLLLLTFPCLIWLIDGIATTEETPKRKRREAAFTGWCFGFGVFIAGLYWIGFAFLVEADKFAWLIPFAISGLPAALALFYAGAMAAAMLLWRPGASRIFVFTAAMFIAEWLRGHILTGFPWNLWGYALTGSDSLMQITSLTGIYGLTLLAILLFASPAALARPYSVTPRGRWLLPVVCLLLLGGGWIWGTMRLASAPDVAHSQIRLRIVQGNIPQADKWKLEKREPNLQRLLDLSATPPAYTDMPAISHLIWPETSLPYLFMLNDAIYVPQLRETFANLLPEGATMVLGAERVEATPRSDGQFTIDKVFNSLFVLDAEARVSSIYDKMHLVPFGEYVPFEKTLELIGIKQLTHLNSGFAKGTQRRLMKAGNAPPFSPLICYEAIFPGRTYGSDGRPGWLLNLTNDAWFGTSTGPYQHLHQVRVRSVEEGLPVVRAANTGISAVIDGYGRIKAAVPLNNAGVLDEALPVALQPTPFGTYGGLSLIVVALMILLLYRVVIAVE
jgi:apolipoprotein N-acyltransferase